jgi:RimJ/RimL family protein N-acetyltransferase
MTTASPPRRIETENLVLRAWRASDAPLLRHAIDSSLDHLRAWMPWAMNEPASLEDTFARLAGYAAKFDAGEDFVYGIFNRDETSVLGGTGLHPRIAADGLEIGYWIRADQVRRGFAVEAARALTEAGLAVPDVVRIQIHCDPANVVSRRIPERLGYRLIEHRSDDTIDPRGLPRDTVVYERRDPPDGSLTKA